ncbi:hypothetical protein [Nocardioides euryhalodurans]|uniref:hypothetical protein n=1 Tax=Nocardioides euryhalodurans TaxID=2518370 RepID=UPI001ABE4107|nr:hypothetical protein [Nocardioides euryhalodurans]
MPDDAMSRRLKAFACTAPLHDLDARKTRLDFAEAGIYQMAEIGLKVIDEVTIAMDFDGGSGYEQVIRRVVPFVAAQAADRPVDEHDSVARWVLDNLINVGLQNREFTSVYGTLNVQGLYEKRVWSFRLLEQAHNVEGDIYLRATDEAINVLVGALDTDVESAQEAAETKLSNLISRGRLSDAQLAAEQARWRTIQYAEQLRRKLDATRRDVRTVDWVEEVPNLIEEALSHIEGRTKAENAILANITTTRDDATDPIRKKQAADLVDIVRECLRRHATLQARLQEAGASFRSEQDRQQFSGEVRKATVDLFGQLLAPTLDLTLHDAAQVTGVFFTAGTGITVRPATRLMDLTYLLLTPPIERDDLGEELPDIELAPATDPDVFDEYLWEQSDKILSVDGIPRRLSGLLDEARELDPDLPHLVALRVLHSFGPEIVTAARQGDDRVLVAIDDGTRLDDPQFAGADLLVAYAPVSLDLADPHDDAEPPTHTTDETVTAHHGGEG